MNIGIKNIIMYTNFVSVNYDSPINKLFLLREIEFVNNMHYKLAANKII